MKPFSESRLVPDDTKSNNNTVPLKSKLPVASRFRRDANRVARYAIRVARESSKRKMSGIN